MPARSGRGLRNADGFGALTVEEALFRAIFVQEGPEGASLQYSETGKQSVNQV